MLEAGMLKRWRIAGRENPGPTPTASCPPGLHPLLGNLLAQRGLADPAAAQAFLHPKLTDLHDPILLPGIVRAVQRVEQALAQRQTIIIYGDYDVDGITASAILWHILRALGADVRTYVPHRIEEGYGLNNQAIEQLCQGVDGKLPLIISVDCGITAVEPAQVARQAGVDLIITDHHEFDPTRLPDAFALVHPHLAIDGKPYPFEYLCGAGVAFKVAWHLARVHCGSERLPKDLQSLLLNLLSFAALGTVADVVPLVGENRVITIHGLGRIKHTPFVGLNALIDASSLRDEKIDAFHVGFVLGPRLNAAGRMGHAQRAVQLLTCAEAEEATATARFLTSENDSRRATERAIFAEARDMVVRAGYDSCDCRAIVLGKEGWHPGVVGIVASRLVEAFSRPVVLLSVDPQTREAHGSARSVDLVSIHEAFSHCATLLTSFGGHAMAAGLRLPADRLDAFRDALVGFINQKLAPEDLVAMLDIDLVCQLEDLSLDLALQMQKLAPFGRGNPSPLFCVRGAKLNQPARRMGSEGRHLNLNLCQDRGQRQIRAVGWSMGHLAEQLPAGSRIDVAFELHASQWQGVNRAEAHLKDLKIC